MKTERTFLVFILCFVMVGLWVLLRPPGSLDPLIQSKDDYNWFWTYKVHHKTKYDVILLGDSRLYRGVSPGAMEKYLPNYSILNFGFSSGGLNGRIFKEASLRFNKNSRKKIVVLAVTPFSLTEESATNEHFITELDRPPSEVYQRIHLRPILKFFKSITPKQFKKSVIRKQKKPAVCYYQKFYPDGWVASDKVPADPNTALKSYRKTFEKGQVVKDIQNDLFQQTKKWVNSGVMVVAFRPPVAEKMLSLENELSGFEQAKFVSQFEHSGGKWIDIPIGEDYVSYDGSHLDSASAVHLSEILSLEIYKSL